MEKDVVEEDAAELKFPPGLYSHTFFSNTLFISRFSEFDKDGCDALLISEVFLLLDHRRKQGEQKEEIEDISEVFVKTIDYCRRLSRFKTRDTIRSVRA